LEVPSEEEERGDRNPSTGTGIGNEIGARVTNQRIIATAAIQRIIANATINGVIAANTKDAIIPALAKARDRYRWYRRMYHRPG
jgi:hypothetical protein